MPASEPIPSEGVFERHSTRQTGFVFDDFAPDSAWIRESATIQFPPLVELRRLVITGEFKPHPQAGGRESSPPSLTVFLAAQKIGTVTPTKHGSWETAFDVPFEVASQGFTLRLVLGGVKFTNFLAWAGRVFAGWPLAGRIQRYRLQNKNRQLRIARIEADGELVYDFGNRHSPYSPTFARKHARIGLNIVGFHNAELGIGESARCMVRAADAAQIPATAVPLKLPCKARMGDNSFSPFLQEKNPHGVNVFHLDAPAAADIDANHGKAFRAGKYNVGYWAWELPEFPDAWIPYFEYLHEIWCPSDFVRAAIADKSPLPVVTMPHAISFRRPIESIPQLRTRFQLPADKFLFLFLYDLHSYSERKNPRAVLAAFRESGLASKDAALVIKVHGTSGNEADLAALQAAVSDLPGTVLITESFSRADIYALEAACDCFVSLHRAEGFGLAVAECMYLGKPVIATDWSATAEYLNESNGCPVRAELITLQHNHGPYSKGQIWANPDVAHAADWMRRLHADRSLAERLGAAARATIEQKFSPEAIGARYRRRLEAIASW
ncbi:MAG: glycosyltransferase family 4 protein [Nibricoccus sp.]